jgi:hypothetical protein
LIFFRGAWGCAPPGYPLVSFSPAAKKDTAAIPCASRLTPLPSLSSLSTYAQAVKALRIAAPAIPVLYFSLRSFIFFYEALHSFTIYIYHYSKAAKSGETAKRNMTLLSVPPPSPGSVPESKRHCGRSEAIQRTIPYPEGGAARFHATPNTNA